MNEPRYLNAKAISQPEPLCAAFRGGVSLDTDGSRLPKVTRGMLPAETHRSNAKTGLVGPTSRRVSVILSADFSLKKESSQLFFHENPRWEWYFMPAWRRSAAEKHEQQRCIRFETVRADRALGKMPTATLVIDDRQPCTAKQGRLKKAAAAAGGAEGHPAEKPFGSNAVPAS